jgi:hypothetical protein
VELYLYSPLSAFMAWTRTYLLSSLNSVSCLLQPNINLNHVLARNASMPTIFTTSKLIKNSICPNWFKTCSTNGYQRRYLLVPDQHQRQYNVAVSSVVFIIVFCHQGSLSGRTSVQRRQPHFNGSNEALNRSCT